ncbi:phage tail protein, partial [Escherichia coli]
RAETAAKRAEDIASAVALEDASTTKKGIVQLSSATNSSSETLAATPKAVKSAYDNAEKRLQKDQNGADIPDTSAAGAHTHSVSGTAASAGAHAHTVGIGAHTHSVAI